MSDIRQIARIASGTLVDTRGNATPGTTDMTAAWETAMAAGGTVYVPGGTYLLSACDIPANQGDITIVPLGPVTVKWPGAGSYALRFSNLANVTAADAVATVANEDSYPSANNQRTTRITATTPGAFTGRVAGEIGHLMSDDQDDGGYIKAEMFEILAVDGGGDYIITTEQQFYAYDASSNTTVVRFFTATPKLIIKPGITFDTSEDETGSPAARPIGLSILAAVRPDIDVRFTSCYTISVDTRCCFQGKFRLDVQDLYTNYADSAFGYGIQDKGASYGCEYWITGSRAGHLIAGNGDLTTYNSAQWYFTGAPKDPIVWRMHAHSCRHTPYDWHWAIRPKCHVLIITGAAEDADGGVTVPSGASLAGYDPWIGSAYIRGIKNALVLRDELGSVNTTITIDHLDLEISGYPSLAAVISNGIAAGSTKPKVRINGGRIAIGAQAAFHNNGSGWAAAGFDVECRNVLFDNCAYAGYWTGTNDMTVTLYDCQYDASDDVATSISVFRYDAANASKGKAFNLTVVPGAVRPNGLVHVTAAVTTTTVLGKVTSTGRAIPDKTSTSDGGATVNFTRAWQSGGARSGSATLSSGTAAVAFDPDEPDALFQITLSGNAAETFTWASKATTGFTINSSNGSSTAVVDWHVVR